MTPKDQPSQIDTLNNNKAVVFWMTPFGTLVGNRGGEVEKDEEEEEHEGQARDVRDTEVGVRSNPGGGYTSCCCAHLLPSNTKHIRQVLLLSVLAEACWCSFWSRHLIRHMEKS
jgi:hypothetical protein